MSERGVAAIEFTYIAPVLILLLFSIIEFSIALYDQAVITNASREAARTAAVFNGDSSDASVAAVVDNYLGNHLISLGSANTHSVVVSQAGGDLTVSVNYTYDFLILPGFTTLNLTGTTVMRAE